MADPGPRDELVQKVADLSMAIEKSEIAPYVELLRNPWRLLYVNLLAGMARGLGSAIGFTLLSALALYVLNWLVKSNLPIIGEFLADIVHLIELHNRGR